MNKKPLDMDNDFDLPPIVDIDLPDEIDLPRPEPIVTKVPEEGSEKKAKESHRILRLVISISASVLLVTGIILWLFMFKGIYIFQGLPLKDFSNSAYSIKVPVGYKVTENNLGSSGTDTTFIDSSEKIEGTQSKVYIVSGEIKTDAKQKYLNSLDTIYSAANIKKSKLGSGIGGAANIEYSTDNLNGMEARTISYDMTKGNDHVGRYNKVSIFKDDKIYEIIVSAPNGNPGLAVDAKKIFNSFATK